MATTLVTGANSGLGHAMALEFARRGHVTLAGMRDLDKGAELAREAARHGVAVRPVRLDVTDAASISSALADIAANEGALDILVNNAGISSNAPLEMLAEEFHRLTFETNYWGPVGLMRRVLPDMRARGGGLIINISSMMRRFGLPGTVPYAASKAALEMASEVVALEAGAFGVRVVVIEPGVVTTKLQANTASAGRWAQAAATPYASVFENTAAIQRAMLAAPMPAHDAARAILDAALAPDPPFRILIGQDANALVPAREAMSDEDWIAMAAASRERHAALARTHLGIERDADRPGEARE